MKSKKYQQPEKSQKTQKTHKLWQHLTDRNAHPRDEHISFDEPTHKYYVNGTCQGNISCTGFIHEFFGHFDPKATIAKMRKSAKWATSKYFGKTDKEITDEWNANGKEASSAGTAMHLAIEQFMHGAIEEIKPDTFETKEWKYFTKFWEEFGGDLEPYRSEWEVFTDAIDPTNPLVTERKIKLCGSIDMVYRRKSDGKFVIYDWKRSKEIKSDNPYESGLAPLAHLPDTNYWHYTMQLNVYKWILENYYGLEVADLYLVILHPDNPSYRRMRLNIMTEEVEDMIECRRRAVEDGCRQSVILPIPEVEVKEDSGAFASFKF
jgi:ATP-dependent exoDNAse (exonuclease V) beta subunit